MIATVTNVSSTASVVVPFPFSITLAPSGSKALGVNLADLTEGNMKGKPAYKELNDMVNKGLITVSFADDTRTADVLDKARNA